jgi:hypothetical protein
MAVPLAGASVAAVGPSALAASVRASASVRAATAEGENLAGVSAVSATDAWAVGYACSNAECSEPNLVYKTLIEHWNGTTWSTVASPNPAPSDQLTGVSAVSATDAWAVGTASSGQTLILHWNGTKWSTTPAPESSNAYQLNGVTAVSATDAWAVGDYSDGTAHTLTLHWNGTKWSVVASPSPGAASNALFGVSTLTPTDAWAVGESLATSPGVLRTVVLRWNGKAWTQVASPDPGSSFSVLDGVSAVSASDAWAVGNYSSTAGDTSSTLILRWNGTDWTKVPSPSPNPDSSGVDNLAGVSTVSPSYAVAAGSSDNTDTGVNLGLIVDWNGTKWAMP